MPSITIKKMIIHELDLKKQTPTVFQRVMDLSKISKDVTDFFETHISNAIVAKQTKLCKFTHPQSAVLFGCVQISLDISNDQLFIDHTIHMTQLLFNVMKNRTQSSGTLIFMIYESNGSNHLAIMKMDPNRAIQLDLYSYSFIIQSDILPSVREKLHKCAFIKLDPNLWNESVHLRVLDKQQISGEVSKYFLSDFLESQTFIDDKAMTKIVQENLVEFVYKKGIVSSAQIMGFTAEVDKMLRSGNEVDIDRDLEDLFKSYIPGEADRLHNVEAFKQTLNERYEDVYFEFTAEKNPTIAIFSDDNNGIKIQFPLQYKDTKIFVEYENEDDGSQTTVIRVKGVLSEKFR